MPGSRLMKNCQSIAQSLGIGRNPPRSASSSTGAWSSTLWEKMRSEEHTSELQSQSNLVCRLLLEKKKSSEYDPLRNRGQLVLLRLRAQDAVLTFEDRGDASHLVNKDPLQLVI